MNFSLKSLRNLKTFFFTGHFEFHHKEIHLLKNVPLQHERQLSCLLAGAKMHEETINVSPLHIVLVLFYLLLVSKVFPTVKELIQEFTTHGMVLLLYCVQRHLLLLHITKNNPLIQAHPWVFLNSFVFISRLKSSYLYSTLLISDTISDTILGSSSLAKPGNPRYVEDIKSGKAETPFEIVGLQEVS